MALPVPACLACARAGTVFLHLPGLQRKGFIGIRKQACIRFPYAGGKSVMSLKAFFRQFSQVIKAKRVLILFLLGLVQEQ